MMTQIETILAGKGIYFLTLLLLTLGLYGIIVSRNYMKKLICMNIMQVAVIFFFLCFAQKNSGTIPVAWIRTAGENPVPYLIALAYPDRDIIDGLDDEGIAKGYETISRNLSARDKKSLYYIFGGDHGSDPHCVIQLILTHLHTPLWDRVGSAQHIMADYELNKAIGRIPETGFNPDLAMINEAIKQAIKSTMEGKNDYTLEAPQEPKK